MPTTTSFDFADVVLVPLPFTDQSTTKKRPAVVISSSAYHRQRQDLILMATSQLRPTQTVGEVVVQHWQAAGLIKPSVLKPLITTIERGLVLRVMGSLHNEDRAALRKALHEVLGLSCALARWSCLRHSQDRLHEQLATWTVGVLANGPPLLNSKLQGSEIVATSRAAKE